MIFKDKKLLKQNKFKHEKEIQTFVENHISDILGEEYEFVCTEFSVGDFRIDTLAFNNETKSFIIIEDKNVENKSLVDQGLTYLKLLRDRKSDFILKYNAVKNVNYNISDIDISQSKVVFVSPYYNKYQIYSADYQNVPFELYKITRYEEDIIDIERIEKTCKEKMDFNIFKEVSIFNETEKEEIKVYIEEDHLEKSTDKVRNLYEILKRKVIELDDIDIDPKKLYIAFKGIRNIIDVEVHKNFLKVYFNMKRGTLNDPLNITEDIKEKGSWGNGDYRTIIQNEDDIDNIIPLVKQSLKVNKK